MYSDLTSNSTDQFKATMAGTVERSQTHNRIRLSVSESREFTNILVVFPIVVIPTRHHGTLADVHTNHVPVLVNDNEVSLVPINYIMNFGLHVGNI
jgi:hypothetical protein